MKSLLCAYARYHAWATDILLRAVASIPDADRRADAGLYFRSIHGTLNHLLLVDRLWRGRLMRQPFALGGVGDELEVDFHALAEALRSETAAWELFVASQEDDALGRPFVYRKLSGVETRVMLAHVLLHLFNHGTHHRGQISAVVTRMGQPVPEMDLVDLVRL